MIDVLDKMLWWPSRFAIAVAIMLVVDVMSEVLFA